MLDSDTWKKLDDDSNRLSSRPAPEKPFTAIAWLKPCKKEVYDGRFCSYMIDYDNGIVSVLVEGKVITTIGRNDLLIFSREVMALEQLFVAMDKE